MLYEVITVVHQDHGAHALWMVLTQAGGEPVVAKAPRGGLFEDAQRGEHAQQPVERVLVQVQVGGDLRTVLFRVGQAVGDAEFGGGMQGARLLV